MQAKGESVAAVADAVMENTATSGVVNRLSQGNFRLTDLGLKAVSSNQPSIETDLYGRVSAPSPYERAETE